VNVLEVAAVDEIAAVPGTAAFEVANDPAGESHTSKHDNGVI